jgi:phospholipid transport system substrate-binding protein
MFTSKSTMTPFLLALLVSAAVTSTVVSAPVQEPREIVQETSDKILEIINRRGEELEKDPETRYRLIDEIILPLIDFKTFSQLVLGTHWRTTTPEQRSRFMQAFKSMLVRTYTKSVSDYAGTEVTVLPARGEQREEYRTVYTEIRTGHGQPPLSVNYNFWLTDGQWKVYDLTIDGLSLVKNFRSSFDNEINRHGLDALIERLERGGEEFAPEMAAP